MGRFRNRGKRTDTVFNEIDLAIFKVITQSTKDLPVMKLKKRLKMTHSALKKHLDWLEEIKLINRIPLTGTRKVIVKPTAEGRTIFKILHKNIPKDSYRIKI